MRTAYSFPYLSNRKFYLPILLSLLMIGGIIYTFMFVSTSAKLRQDITFQLDNKLRILLSQINLEFEKNTIETKNLALNNSLKYPLALALYPQVNLFCQEVLTYGGIKHLIVTDTQGTVVYSNIALFIPGKQAKLKILRKPVTGYLAAKHIYIYSYFPMYIQNDFIGSVITVHNILDYQDLIQNSLARTSFELRGYNATGLDFVIWRDRILTNGRSFSRLRDEQTVIEKNAYISTQGNVFLELRPNQKNSSRISLNIAQGVYKQLLSKRLAEAVRITVLLLALFTVAAIALMRVLRSHIYRNLKSGILVNNLRAQKHEFVKHINILYGLAQLGKTDQLQEYLQSITDNLIYFDEPAKIKNPVVSVLIRKKEEECKAHDIRLLFQGNTDLTDTPLDGYEIATILTNLIDNAVEASLKESENRLINIEISYQSGVYVMAIANRGTPIRDKDLKKIFRYGYTTKKGANGKSHGIGLFIVKKIIRKHGGSIDVEYRNGFTVFTVYLPDKE